MERFEQLVKALRWCSVDEYVPCTGCPMNEETHGTGCFNIMHQRAADAIEELQAQLPKRGKWIYKPKDAIEMMFTLPKCSVCGYESSDALNYCPNCGSLMRGEANERG